MSSAHVLFPTEDQATALVGTGLAHRVGLQYHWKNEGYGTFDDFLGRFNSKRRNQIKREVRGPGEQGLDLETLGGRDFGPELIDVLYEFYVSTVNKYFYGRQYLNRAFFEELCARVPEAVLVVLARDRASRRPIAGAFNLLGKKALYGRYWGATEERPFLHFNVCYYEGIRECIARGLSLFEPGAGGEHKLARGFEPTVTHSAHHLVDRRLDAAVRDFVERERAAVYAHVEEYARDPVVKREVTEGLPRRSRSDHEVPAERQETGDVSRFRVFAPRIVPPENASGAEPGTRRPSEERHAEPERELEAARVRERAALRLAHVSSERE